MLEAGEGQVRGGRTLRYTACLTGPISEAALLKFFRLYNKYILVVGGAILMVAFLIQPALETFMPQQGDQPVGTLDGETITYADQSTAAAELHLLGQVPVLGQFAGDDPLKWLLMVHEAQQMGLSASNTEVQQLLQMVGVDDSVKARMQQQLRASSSFIEQAFRHWLIVQKYRELMLAQVHSPVTGRLQALTTAQQMFQQGNVYGGMMWASMASGSPRVSEPLVRRFLYNQYATVSGETVLIEHDRYLDQVEAPTQEALETLFDQYRDVLPGEGEPYGFGYRTPARVKMEVLRVPFDQVAEQIEIDEAQRQDYYDQNRDRYVTEDDGEPQPYAQVRDRITRELRQQRATQLGQEIIRTARNVLMEDEAARRLSESGGYRQIPDDFEPLPLARAAEVVEQRYGVRPLVEDHSDQWTALHDVESLPGVGDGFLASRREVTLTDYVASAREMNPSPDNALIPLRLQVGLPSAPMQTWDGSYFLFRLTDAADTHSPENLDEVRAQVEDDARRLAAYRLLLEDRQRWLDQAKQQGMQSFASEMGAAMLNVPPTPRRSDMSGNGGPSIPGIGPAGDLLAAMFEVGQEAAGEDGELGEASADARTGTAAMDSRLSLAVFRVDGFRPMTEGDYESISSDPRLGAAVSQSLVSEDGDEPSDPLSLEAISKRVRFVSADEDS